jgi:cell division septation protein DedD
MAEERGAARRSRREGRGLVSVLIGTALLGVLGFGLGIVAGLVLEEPGLLLDYLTGRTTSARLEKPEEPTLASATAPAAAAPDVAAPSAPTRAEPTPPPAAETSERAEPPTPPPVGAAPPPAAPPVAAAPTAPIPEEPPAPAHAGQTGYSVQVGALADAAGAEQLAAKLEKRGFHVYVAPSAEPGSRRWRVRVGPVATREEAQRLAGELEREKLPTWVLAEGRR